MKFINLISKMIGPIILLLCNISIGIKFIYHPEKGTIGDFKIIGIIFILGAFINLTDIIKKIQEYEK